MRTTVNYFTAWEIIYDETKYRNPKGNIVKRNPVKSPYSYDSYVLYKSLDYKKTDRSYYSDRVVVYSYLKKEKIDKALSQMVLSFLMHPGKECHGKMQNILNIL